ncbi:UDP-glycosyltransferase 88B1 [Vitis vinifera]|uniref:UDP-glycosyltransferase 88B1 n=1 Tax=Vitis vinifera TaxID=29760 RepID=A0A438ICW6_VITVI|nr:UDP-glycosyltransferase 88B1 [Vitis vinifera]RVX01901.1 UDP-glycosyltransferase 88B1 [Vitis vinifera]
MKNVVLYPSPGMGHLISMVELGKLIVEHYPSLCITILTITAPFDTGATGPYISAVSAPPPPSTSTTSPSLLSLKSPPLILLLKP